MVNETAVVEAPNHTPHTTAIRYSFKLCKPYTTTKSTTPYLIDGIVRQGGLCALAGKPKLGKSSLARYAAVQISKGLPFLGRDTQRAESLIISVEDPTEHIDSALRALEYDPTIDEAIHLVDSVSRKLDENIAAVRETLELHPFIRFVVIDTLPKLVKVRDQNSYDEWLPVLEEFRQIIRDFPSVSMLCLLHFKKNTGDDIFDSMLGSSALRGEFDSNLGLYKTGSTRLFTTESRIGRAIDPTVINGEVVEIDGSNLVSSFMLGATLDCLEEQKKAKATTKRSETMDERIVAYMTGCEAESVAYGSVCEAVTGRDTAKREAIARLLEGKTLIASGTKNSPTDPYMLTLDRSAVPMYDFISKFKGRVN